MELLAGQRTFIWVGVFLFPFYLADIEGRKLGTITPALLKDPKSFTEFEGPFKDLFRKTLKTMLEEEIEIQLQSSRAKKFLDGLSNQFQREIVLTNLRLCPFVSLCQFKLNFYRRMYSSLITTSCCSPCSCDKDKCLSTGTCCPDILWTANTTPDLNNDVRESCVPTEIIGIDKDIVHHIKAISVCPADTDSELLTKCVRNYESNLRDLDIEDLTLVSDISSDRIFRNKYCAECNFVNSSSRLYWSPRLECSHSQELSIITKSMELIEQILYSNISCNVKLQQPKINTNVKSCTSSISVCNSTGLWESYDPDLDMACGLYGSVVRVTKRQTVRNVFCALCNGFNPTPTDICASYFTIPTPVNFAGLLRLSDSVQENGESCGKDEKYDSIQDKCRQTVCSDGRELKNGRCELIFDGAVTMDLEINLCLYPQDPIPLPVAYDIVPTVESVVLEEISNRVNHKETICDMNVLLQSNLLSNQTTNRNRLSGKWTEVAYQAIHSELKYYLLSIRISINAHLEKTVESLKSLQGAPVFLNGTKIPIPYVEKPSPFFVMKLVQDANKMKLYKMSSVMNDYFKEKDRENGVIDINRAVSLSYSLSLFDENDNMLQIPYLHLNNQYEEYCKHENPSYALLSLKSCPMFKIAWEEFDFKENFNGIEIEGTAIRFNAEEYSIVTKSESMFLLICVDTYLEKLKLQGRSAKDVDPVKKAKIVVSLICLCASIVCLIFSLVTYCMFKQLQTLPDKNNIALIVSLAFAQVCYLVGGTANFYRNGVICKTVGVLIHIFWLVSMFWMNICTFHMCQVLMKIRNMSHRSNFRRYVYYHLYCISMTLICVFVNVGVSMATSGSTDIGYGKIICYISTQKMVDFTFGVPSVLVVISNFSMFLAVIISLKRQPSIRQNVNDERKYFVVFMKLSTVTGITWIFGFLYMWTGLEAFSFFFIILNASQGIFIMLAFVCNKRIITLYKKLLSNPDRSPPSKGIRSAGTSSTPL